MASGPPTDPSANPFARAEVWEYRVMYTAQVRQKLKRWNDGLLRYHVLNKKVQVTSDASGAVAASAFLKDPGVLVEGNEFVIDGGSLLVSVERFVGSTERDLSKVFPKAGRAAAAVPATQAPLLLRGPAADEPPQKRQMVRAASGFVRASQRPRYGTQASTSVLSLSAAPVGVRPRPAGLARGGMRAASGRIARRTPSVRGVSPPQQRLPFQVAPYPPLPQRRRIPVRSSNWFREGFLQNPSMPPIVRMCRHESGGQLVVQQGSPLDNRPETLASTTHASTAHAPDEPGAGMHTPHSSKHDAPLGSVRLPGHLSEQSPAVSSVAVKLSLPAIGKLGPLAPLASHPLAQAVATESLPPRETHTAAPPPIKTEPSSQPKPSSRTRSNKHSRRASTKLVDPEEEARFERHLHERAQRDGGAQPLSDLEERSPGPDAYSSDSDVSVTLSHVRLEREDVGNGSQHDIVIALLQETVAGGLTADVPGEYMMVELRRLEEPPASEGLPQRPSDNLDLIINGLSSTLAVDTPVPPRHATLFATPAAHLMAATHATPTAHATPARLTPTSVRPLSASARKQGVFDMVSPLHGRIVAMHSTAGLRPPPGALPPVGSQIELETSDVLEQDDSPRKRGGTQTRTFNYGRGKVVGSG